jgi:hypothetical protein
MTSPPTEYPASWPGARPSAPPPPPPSEPVALAIDAYIASLSDEELKSLLARTRG